MAAMDATGQCYCDPCDSSSPAITGGSSLVTAMTAFLFIAQVRFVIFELESLKVYISSGDHSSSSEDCRISTYT